jgi:hypothetical protein
VKDSHAQSVFRTLPRRPRRERAFSLHEALVALTVISTVSAAALPTSLHLISNQRVAGAVNSLITALPGIQVNESNMKRPSCQKTNR